MSVLAFKRTIVVLGLALGLNLDPVSAAAHVTTVGPWADTLKKLRRLYPAADPNAWKVKRHVYSDGEVAKLEKLLRLSLYPEDREPTFFFAQDSEGALLGVAVFVDPRPEPKLANGKVVPMEVAVGVDAAGTINSIVLVEHDGDAPLGEPVFLDQLIGRNLGCTFVMGKGGLTPLPDAKKESQHVANAAREALLLMKAALGVESPPPPCTR